MGDHADLGEKIAIAWRTQDSGGPRTVNEAKRLLEKLRQQLGDSKQSRAQLQQKKQSETEARLMAEKAKEAQRRANEKAEQQAILDSIHNRNAVSATPLLAWTEDRPRNPRARHGSRRTGTRDPKFSGISLPVQRKEPSRSPRDTPFFRPRDYNAVPVSRAEPRKAPAAQTRAVPPSPTRSRQRPPEPRRSNSNVLPKEKETTIPRTRKRVTARSRDGTPAPENWCKNLGNEARKFCSKHCLLLVAALFCLFSVSDKAMSPYQQGDQAHRGTGTSSSDASWYTNPWTWMVCAALGYASTYFYDPKQLPSAQSMTAPGLRPVKPEHAIGAKPRSEDTDTKSQWIWIIVAIAVLLAVGGGVAAFFYCKSSPSYGAEEDQDLEHGRRRHRYHRRRRE